MIDQLHALAVFSHPYSFIECKTG